ncbi:LuxR C-terminal-related transcriptional regulator [Streptomyces sp. NBC_01210]|uniref:LuxR C-terminal-related transcriptional regulator n=1 Tax=Streptomyces sp. NBC_01210 TaxID=2903774 RepID=UPI002E0E2F10|nr:LuxR C-terminal-related transcriptional regulator [Streptomyces sp. NBC_01210]
MPSPFPHMMCGLPVLPSEPRNARHLASSMVYTITMAVMSETHDLMGRATVARQVEHFLVTGTSVVVTGAPGIGRTAFLDHIAERLSTTHHVLRSTALPCCADVPLETLHDLLVNVADSAGDAAGMDRRAALNVLSDLARTTALTVILDDAHHLDTATADALTLARRRVRGLTVLASVPESARWLEALPPVRVLTLEPLHDGVVTKLLEQRYGNLPEELRLLVVELSSGNPLYAIELAKALRSCLKPLRPFESIPITPRLRAVLDERLHFHGELDNQVLLAAAAAWRPTRRLLAAFGSDESIARAEQAGVLVSDAAGCLRFTQPLYGRHLYVSASVTRRRDTHAALSVLASDPLEELRNRALATRGTDRCLAAALAACAKEAARTDPSLTLELSYLACVKTPPDAQETLATRLLAQSTYALGSGRPLLSRHLAESAINIAGPSVRATARLQLAEAAGEDSPAATEFLDAALADAKSDARVEARVRLARARALHNQDLEASLEEAARAEKAARQSQDDDLLISIESWRGVVELTSGRTEGAERLEWAHRHALRRGLSVPAVQARRMWATELMHQGESARALAAVHDLRIEVERHEQAQELGGVLSTCSALLDRAGRCANALVVARRAEHLLKVSDPFASLLARAAAEVNAGSAAVALDRATRALEKAGPSHGNRAVALAVVGRAQLVTGDVEAAVGTFQQLAVLTEHMGMSDPAVTLWQADFAEALIAARQPVRAYRVIRHALDEADRLGRWAALVGLSRAEALWRAADGDATGAATGLRGDLDRWYDHPYRLDIARGHLALGKILRRSRRKGLARVALTEAFERLTIAGAAPWAQAAASERALLEGNSDQQNGPSAVEEQIIEMLKHRASNREIADTLCLSIKTVEAHLTRLYRRHRVRNRRQLIDSLDRARP